LRKIVRAVVAKEAAVPRAMVLELMRELRGAVTSEEGLTGREGQVLGLLRRGHSTAAIAERLEIAPVTVRRHISDVVRKLGVDNRSDLTGNNDRSLVSSRTSVHEPRTSVHELERRMGVPPYSARDSQLP
jgi:DNA-binding NarL/FixJ family response regulator